MDRLLRLVGLVVLPLLVGCIPVPVGSKYPPALVGESALESMIGENNESILVSLGSPGVVLSSETSTYYIYGAHGSEYQALLMVWVPVAGQKSPKGKLFCVLLEFDDEKIFRRYKINRHSKFWSEIDNVSDCALSFFTPEELEALMTEDAVLADSFVEKELQQRAEEGDFDAQWRLYSRRKHDGEYGFKWLCRAAEQGDNRARWELGYIYQRGLYGVRKDLVMSVMWFSLLEPEGYGSGSAETIRKLLTPEELNRAKYLHENWEPGQCEREILGTEPSNSN